MNSRIFITILGIRNTITEIDVEITLEIFFYKLDALVEFIEIISI